MLTLPLPRTIAELSDSWERVEWQDRASRSFTEVWSRRAGLACLGILWLVTFWLLWITRDVVAAANVALGLSCITAMVVGLPRLGCDVCKIGVRVRVFILWARVVPWTQLSVEFKRYGYLRQSEFLAVRDSARNRSVVVPNAVRTIGGADRQACRLAGLADQLSVLAASARCS